MFIMKAMPRRTDQHYLQTHRQLRRLWEHAQSAYGHLSPTEQWLLHDYFQPSKDLTDLELLEHRAQISRERPALPQQAGKALAQLYEAAAQVAVRSVHLSHQAKLPKYARQPHRQIQVYGVVNPEIDLHALLHVLLDIAEH
jgi:hypothetical protein